MATARVVAGRYDLGRPLGPPVYGGRRADGRPAWEALLDTATAAAAWWAEPLERRLPALIELDGVVAPPDGAATRTCHRDLNVDDVRRRRGGGPVVLDWENCGALEPVRELAGIVASLREDVSRAAALSAYAEYVKAGGPARVTEPADFSTAIVVQGHLLRYYGERSLDPAAPAEDRRRGDRRVRAILDRPLTPAAVSDLLAALAPYA